VGERTPGWLGLFFFVSALIMMPLLVFTYDAPKRSVHSASPDAAPDAGASAGDRAHASASASASASAPVGASIGALAAGEQPPSGEIHGFTGLDGRPLRGVVRIGIQYSGSVGRVRYDVRDDKPRFRYVAAGPPYLLDPHDPKIDGWDTNFLPDGEYTITATAEADPRIRHDARLIIQNR
jgi:hypothetical protein